MRRIYTSTLGFDDEIIVDNFAGGGGASTGIELALGRAVDVAINHDPEAVALHTENHPATWHHCEDVFKVDPVAATRGAKVGLGWFSPDCKHFSKAKGGKPRSKEIRGLAWVMVNWAEAVRPRVLMLENVEEFKTWGPLLADGTPCKRRKGRTFFEFIGRLKKLGYVVDYRELRACDYGAPTIRKRLFLIARCDGRPIVWPAPTHGAPDSDGVKSGALKPWRTAAECIDWSIPCKSIFERERPLAEATMRRIARGIVKFVRDAKKPFIVNVANSKTTGRGPNVWDVEEPLRTVTASPGFAMVAPVFTECANASTQRIFDPQEPLRTQCAQVKGGHFALATATLIQTGYGEREGQLPRVPDIGKPLGTVVAGGVKHAVVSAHITKFRTGSVGSEMESPLPTITAGKAENAAWNSHAMGLVSAHIQKFYGERREGEASRGTSADDPLHTLSTENRMGVVSAFLAKHYTEKAGQVQGASLDAPAPTITATDHNSVVAAHMVRQFGASTGSAMDEPAGTVTAGGGGKTAVAATFVTKLRGTNLGQPMEEPLHTVTGGGTHFAQVCAFLEKYTDGAFTDGIVTIEGESYCITDIGLRMLEPHELYKAQGFPDAYRIDEVTMGGVRKRLPKHAQVRMCGNSVCPPMSQALAAANVPEMSRHVRKDEAA